MVAKAANQGGRFFPALCVQFRTAKRSSKIVLSPIVQGSVLAGVAAIAAALVYLGVSQIGYIRLVDKEELAVARVESANVDLQGDVAALRDRLAVAARDRAAAEDRLSRLTSQADELRGQLELTETKLLALEQKASERETAPPPEQTSEARLLEPPLSRPAPSEANPEQPEMSGPGLSTPAKMSSEGVADIGRRAIAEFKRVLASAGVDVVRLFSRFSVNRAEGGPFVPPAKANQPVGAIERDGLAVLRGLVTSLPLSLPLDHYQVGSRFGLRRDPFNGKPAFHSGLDFDAGYMSPVYATAPGIVTYAGYRGGYGKVVEIDHGNGIATLYGHMHRYMVAVGQRVDTQTQIGLVGSTGRASGPHVHYEVIVNGQPQNPEKFMGLAHLASIAEK
jgi:murein DD-endopeptidase MepM/ murein hydrolase activator NlpD